MIGQYTFYHWSIKMYTAWTIIGNFYCMTSCFNRHYKLLRSSGILMDKTMEDSLMHIPNDYKPFNDYPFGRFE